MTSKRLSGSVWVRLFENKNLYKGSANIRATKIAVQRRHLNIYFFLLILFNLYATTELANPAIIKGKLNIINNKYLLTK